MQSSGLASGRWWSIVLRRPGRLGAEAARAGILAAVERIHVWISGSVQGVFFRYETRQRARARGLAGWVRNLPDGRVEAVFEGHGDAVNEMVRWCHHGPDGAYVTGVEVRAEDAEGLRSFDVTR